MEDKLSVEIEFDELIQEIESGESDQKKTQIISMIKKLHLAVLDVLKMIRHYKKILDSGHPIPNEIIKQLYSMANQLIKTSSSLNKKADKLVDKMEVRLQHTRTLLQKAEDILEEIQK